MGRESFVGEVIAKLEELRGDADHRILAIKGPLGSGKSNVLVAAARQLMADSASPALLYVPVRGLTYAPLVVRRIVHMISPKSAGDGMKALEAGLRSLSDHTILILDDLEDCAYSNGKSTQVQPTDIPLSDVINKILKSRGNLRLLLSTRFELSVEGKEIVYMDIPPLDETTCNEFVLLKCPHLTKEERRVVAKYARGIPYALELLCTLAKYTRKSPEVSLEEATQRFEDMNIAYWTETDHLLYILVELVCEVLPKHLENAIFGLCIYHGAFTRESVSDLLTYANPPLVERHILNLLQRYSLLSYNTMLCRYEMQPVVAKHGYASLEDHEHRGFRRAFIFHYFGRMMQYVNELPDTMDYLEYMQNEFRLDIPHMMRAIHYCTDLRDQDVNMMMELPQNLLFLAFPMGSVYRFLQRACNLAQSADNAFHLCATHLMLTFLLELTDNVNDALISLAGVFHGALNETHKIGVSKEDVMAYRDLIYFSRHVERRLKLRADVFSQEKAKEAAQLAYQEFHASPSYRTPFILLYDLYTIACAGRWPEVPAACKRLFEQVRVAMTDGKEQQVEESARHAICRYACDGMLVFITYTFLALHDSSLLPPVQEILRCMALIRLIGLQLATVDQRDAVNELTKKWHTLHYTKVAAMNGVPFEVLILAIIRSHRFTNFPADPMIVAPGSGLPDWLLSLDETQPMRMYMQADNYEPGTVAMEAFVDVMERLTLEEKKILVLLNKVWSSGVVVLSCFACVCCMHRRRGGVGV